MEINKCPGVAGVGETRAPRGKGEGVHWIRSGDPPPPPAIDLTRQTLPCRSHESFLSRFSFSHPLPRSLASPDPSNLFSSAPTFSFSLSPMTICSRPFDKSLLVRRFSPFFSRSTIPSPPTSSFPDIRVSNSTRLGPSSKVVRLRTIPAGIYANIECVALFARNACSIAGEFKERCRECKSSMATASEESRGCKRNSNWDDNRDLDTLVVE